MNNKVKFQPENFPKGTLAEYQITLLRKEPKTIEVDFIQQNGFASWVIISTEDNPDEFIGGKMMVNIDHVTRIVKLGNKEDIRTYENLNPFVKSGFIKHKSEYGFLNGEDFTASISFQFKTRNMFVDYNKLWREIKPLCKERNGLEKSWPSYRINKKKVKNLIKSKINHALLKKKVLRKEEEEVPELDLMLAEFD